MDVLPSPHQACPALRLTTAAHLCTQVCRCIHPTCANRGWWVTATFVYCRCINPVSAQGLVCCYTPALPAPWHPRYLSPCRSRRQEPVLPEAGACNQRSGSPGFISRYTRRMTTLRMKLQTGTYPFPVLRVVGLLGNTPMVYAGTMAGYRDLPSITSV